MNNPVGWFEIATTDLERARQFYADVFKYEFQYIDMPGSKMYMFAGGPESLGSMGALLAGDDEVTPSTVGTLIYFQSEDVAIQEARIEAAGGKVIVPKISLGEFGFMVQFIDTEGNKIGIHSNS